jgi:hypothetical protein
MTRRPKRNRQAIYSDHRRDMWSGCNSGSPGAADCRASLGEWVFAEVMIEGVSAIAGVSKLSEEALNFILVAGPGGHHQHPADNGLLPLPSGSGMVFLCAQRRQRAFGGLETVNRNQVSEHEVWVASQAGALGQWPGHRPKSGVVAPPAARGFRPDRRSPRHSVRRYDTRNGHETPRMPNDQK